MKVEDIVVGGVYEGRWLGCRCVVRIFDRDCIPWCDVRYKSYWWPFLYRDTSIRSFAAWAIRRVDNAA